MSDDRKDEERKTPSWQLPQERQPDTDAYHIWTPRPLLRSIYWKPVPAPPFEAISATYEIFLDQRAWLTMHEHAWQTPAEKTPFGYLIGDLCEDPNANRRFVSITSALPARFDFREDAADQISREATLALQLEVERRRGVLAGWYHRHLGGEVRMSENDVRTHHKHFSEPWQCAFVYVGGGDRCEGGCFRSSPEEFAGDMALPFYEMASNESLLARGVKRSYVDWSNYATVDEIRSEPPPRPTIELPSSVAPAGGEEPAPAVAASGARSESKIEPKPPAEDTIPPDATPRDAKPRSEEEPRLEEEQAQAEAETSGEPEPAVASEGAAGTEPELVGAAAPTAEPREDDTPSEPSEPTAETTTPELDVEPYAIPASGGEPVPVPSETEVTTDPARHARIELDPDAMPTPSPSRRKDVAVPGRALSGDDVLKKAALKRDTGVADAGIPARAREKSRSKPKEAWKGVPTSRKMLVGAAVGSLVLVAAVVGGWILMSSDGDEAGAARAGQVDRGAGAGDPPAAMVTAAQVDSAGRAMLATISRFYGQAVARDNGEATCEDLARAFVDVENAWISYSTGFKAEFEGPLPADLAARDDRLYAGVQDTEREFDQSGCPRP